MTCVPNRFVLYRCMGSCSIGRDLGLDDLIRLIAELGFTPEVIREVCQAWGLATVNSMLRDMVCRG
jgi:hypothetical protein